MRIRSWLSFFASCWMFAAVAHAQTADQKAAAEALFDKGVTLMKQGEYAQACTYLEQSNAVERGIGTMLYLAECYEKTGRSASAWALFREAASAAKAEGQLERAQTGTQRATQLEPQLARLAILVPPAAQVPGLAVTRNGVAVSSAVWGVAVPVDPGPQRIEARAPGYESWTHTENLAKAGSLSMTVPPLTAAAPGSAPVAATTAPEPAAPLAAPSPIPPPADKRSDSGSLQRTAALITGGAGVVALGLGTYFGVKAASKNSDADEVCPDGDCLNNAAFELHESAQTNATLSNVFVFGGAAVLAAGIVLFVTAPDEESPETALRIEPFGPGLALRGAL